jgi:hypothetical protein
MTRFQVTDAPTSPSPSMTYSFSCITHSQVRYHTSFIEAGVPYTTVTEQYTGMGGHTMTIVHFYDC